MNLGLTNINFVALFFIYFILYSDLNNVNGASISGDIKHCREDKLETNIEERSSQFSRIQNRINSDMLIDIKFVVLHNGNQGKLSYNQINKQINVLNTAYSGKYYTVAKDSKIRRLYNA
tara:strand:- start:342 stop:698 length:357 start_codon:yes stop_codon:yes gene_type:complete